MAKQANKARRIKLQLHARYDVKYKIYDKPIRKEPERRHAS